MVLFLRDNRMSLALQSLGGVKDQPIQGGDDEGADSLIAYMRNLQA